MYLTDRPSPEFGPGDSARPRAGRVAATVVLMGTVSLFTDISSESVSAILALYLTTVVGLSPLAYGFTDGLYQGASALVRILGGWTADRSDHPKWVAAGGYALSALTRLALIPAHGLAAITTVLTLDRLGKGVRTAPRDLVIATSSEPADLGRAFGVHRMLDTLGAVIGPFLAFAILLALPGDFRAVFVVSFGAALIGLAVLVLLVPNVRPRREKAAGGPTALGPTALGPTALGPGVRRAVRPSSIPLRHRSFRRIVIVVGLLGVLTISDGFLYLALQQRDELAFKYFPLLYVGTNFAYMALAWPFGRIADRVGRGTVFVAGHVALIAAYLCAGGPWGGAVSTIACLLLLGAYYAATDGQLAAMTSALFLGSGRGTAIATAQTAQALARFASSLIVGATWTLAGERTAILVMGAVLVPAVIGAWCWLRPIDSARGPLVAA
jgi:MFS family permease